MRKTRKNRHHLSKSSQNEIIAAKVTLAVGIAISLLIAFSLGTRTVHSALSPLNRQYEKITRFFRNWEQDAAQTTATLKTDLRAHSGFHFEWPARLNPPQFTLERVPTPERIQTIDNLLKLGRSKAILRATTEHPNKFLLTEYLDTDGRVTIHKDVHLLLPGEKIGVRFDSISTAARQWKLRLRTVAVTQDRLDSPLSALVGFPREASSPLEIDPQGRSTDLDVPSFTEFSRRGEKIYNIEWPKSASGILVLEGFQPGTIDTESRAQGAKNLVVYIDKMNAPLTRLTKTLETINRLTPQKKNKFYFNNVIPTADSYSLAREAVLTGRTPVELGASLKNEKLRNTLSPQHLLIAKTLSKGGSARRIQLSAQDNCNEKCKDNVISSTLDSAFTSEMKIIRREEFASTQVYLRNDDFLNDPGLLFVDVEIPQEKLRLNWETIHLSEASTARWITAGLLESIGKLNLGLKNDEKIAQLDLWLAGLVESFLSNPNRANVAFVLHDNGSPVRLSSDSKPQKQLTRGEVFLHLHDAVDIEDNKTNLTTVDAPTALQNIARLFEKRAQSNTAESGDDSLLVSNQQSDEPISQLQSLTYVTLTRDGWLVDPKHSNDKSHTKHIFRAEPEKIQNLQERANAARKKSRLFGLHLTLPNNNVRDEIIEAELSTSLNGLGCESQTENAQLKSMYLKETAAGSETP
jgi:hypothetical protein